MESSENFKCDQCEINFKTDQGLKIHYGKSHKSEDEPENLGEVGKDKSLELSLSTEDRDDKTNHLVNSTLNSDEEDTDNSKKKEHSYPQKCYYEQCDLVLENNTEFVKHIMIHMKRGD